jgi:diguanylate cyclase (GGDEF)-like protein
MWQDLEQKGSWQGEVWNRRKNGEIFPEYLSISVVRNSEGEITNYVAVFADVTEKKNAEERIRHMANHDPLTQLANRTLFNDRLNLALANAERSGECLAIMYLDLDRFKNINDTLGHPTGDEIIKTVAQRLEEVLRDGDTISRLGGDEFTILLPGIGSERDAAIVASKLLKSMALPHTVDGREIFITASIGIAIYPNDGLTRDDLIKNADSALYHAKERGRDSFQFYTQAMNASALERFSLESGLRRALERQEFVLFFQPQADLSSGRLVGAEALIRWQHSELGLVPPGQFIPLLEETGLIVPVGEWVLQEACRQAREWQQQGHRPVRISVNISPMQFKKGELVTLVRAALADSGLAPSLLELEITESSLMDDVEENVAILQRLKAMGVQLAIDDFGTGFSSLSYLKRFPIDVLKIDQSFVRDVTEDPEDAAIAAAIIALGQTLELKVIAEGVETADQLAFLRQRRCDLVQGYLISRPVPPAEFIGFLADSDTGLLN